MGFWSRREKKPVEVQVMIDPEKVAELGRQIETMVKAMNDASAKMQESARVFNKAAEQFKKNKPRH